MDPLTQTARLLDALSGLAPDQSDKRRREARAAVKYALRRLEQMVDQDYPAPKRKAPKRKPKPEPGSRAAVREFNAKRKALSATHQVVLSKATHYARLGVKLEEFDNAYWVPRWVLCCDTDAEIKRCVKSASHRRVVEARNALITDDGGE